MALRDDNLIEFGSVDVMSPRMEKRLCGGKCVLCRSLQEVPTETNRTE